MKPYIEINNKKIHLPQQVDPHRFEICSIHAKGADQYLLCPKVKTRYRQATGVHIELSGNEFTIPVVSGKIVKRTFPLEGLETIAIKIDWSAGAAPAFVKEESEPVAAE